MTVVVQSSRGRGLVNDGLLRFRGENGEGRCVCELLFLKTT